MSLEIKGWRKVLGWLFWAILGVLLLVFLVKVLVFEQNYYSEKEGSERQVVENSNENNNVDYREELVEVEPTETEVVEYTVAPDRPRYLTISKIGVNRARILPMGVNASGELATPNNIFDVGWYESSGKPGQGGTSIIDGHNGGPHVYGVFKKLPNLVSGDIITIERGDGAVFNYTVVENVEVLLSEADAYMSVAAQSPERGKESITLITCTGEWSQRQQTYLSRQFTRAILLEE